MSDIKLIALDLDGTLLNSSLNVSDRNGEAVRRAREAGVKVVLATSRWYLLARRTADRLGIDTPLICNNGAIVKRPADGAELLHLRLDQEPAQEVTALGKIFEVAKGVDAKTMSLQYFETLKTIGESPSTKYVFPLEFTNFLRPFASMFGDSGDGSGIPSRKGVSVEDEPKQ